MRNKKPIPWKEGKYIRKQEDCILISIDESMSSTGIAIFINGEFRYYGNIAPKGENKKEFISEELLALFARFLPDVLVLEDVYQGKCINGFKANVFLQGVCFAYACLHACDYFTYYPSQWRKLLGIGEAGIKRNALKELDKQYIREKYGLEVNDDIADAVCIGLAHIKYVDDLWNNA